MQALQGPGRRKHGPRVWARVTNPPLRSRMGFASDDGQHRIPGPL